MSDDVSELQEFQPPLDACLFVEDGLNEAQDSEVTKVTDEEVEMLRKDIRDHLETLRLPSWANGESPGVLSKEGIRAMHAHQRREVIEREKTSLGHKWPLLLENFANGRDVEPEAIEPVLIPVRADDWTGELFRFAALLWSVPVSKGYGRRMRYLVRDRSNGKLIGIFALGDPVFNLRARDEWIGWEVEQRRTGLVHVMDAHVVGAVPPYSYLLGGKLVTSLIGSAEVSEAFAHRYAESEGIISKKQKAARLALVTVTSALGRSSIYNRLRLTTPVLGSTRERTLVELIRIGVTEGYGHFQLSDELFNRLRDLVARKGHAYANAHKFGQGPNWRIRLARVGLGMLGLDSEFLRHGIGREIYVMPMSPDTRPFLRAEIDEIRLDRPTVREIADAAKRRWILPRSQRRKDYTKFERAQLAEQLLRLMGEMTVPLPLP